MKTFTADGRVLTSVRPPEDDPGTPNPAEIETADRDEALAAYPRPRTVTLPGREPLDLEAISDLWLD